MRHARTQRVETPNSRSRAIPNGKRTRTRKVGDSVSQRHDGGKQKDDLSKMIFLAVAHALATLVIWQHFFYVKYRVKEAEVPDGVNLYWWKRLTPPIAYGAKQAIMFQMMLLPLTMARQTVAAMSNTYFGRKLVPLHKIFAMHAVSYTHLTLPTICSV